MLTTKQSKTAFEAVVQVAHDVATRLVAIQCGRPFLETFELGYTPKRAVLEQLEAQFAEQMASPEVRERALTAATRATGIENPDDLEKAAIAAALHPQAYRRGRIAGFDFAFKNAIAGFRSLHGWI